MHELSPQMVKALKNATDRAKKEDDNDSVTSPTNPNYPIQKPFILHRELHKKTYFHALEKLLTSPKQANSEQVDLIFEVALRNPPKNYNRSISTVKANQ